LNNFYNFGEETRIMFPINSKAENHEGNNNEMSCYQIWNENKILKPV